MIMKRKGLSVIAAMMAFAVMTAAGCGTEVSTGEEDTTKESATMEAVDADVVAKSESVEWPEEITLVQMPNENNPNAGQKHDEFRQAMEEYLGIQVNEMEGTEYSVGIEGMASGKIDVMLVSPMSYYQAKERAGAELLVSTPTAEDYHTVFITQADNDEINSLEDLKGKSFAFVDQASSSGYMYPKAKLVQDLDLDPALLENSDYFFSTVAFAGQHPAVATGVSMGDYDAGAVAASVLTQMSDAGALDLSTIKIIDQTETIPNPAYVIRGDLPEDLKNKIKEFFLNYDDEDYFEQIHGDKSIRFVDVTEDDYKIIYDTLEVLGIDGETK